MYLLDILALFFIYLAFSFRRIEWYTPSQRWLLPCSYWLVDAATWPGSRCDVTYRPVEKWRIVFCVVAVPVYIRHQTAISEFIRTHLYGFLG